ncbi:LutC/YkgG family protein [Streptacidiphilus rugosus]|uniref:LutC/YkgG family protein n=1 Tax=Streptacidiphilus rugosus TaxID=405783 RepID=UPI00056044DE|nr:LUD domain-containing protein [Streptacidiphilus rugosus]
MTSARDEILARIRAATADLPADPVEIPRSYLPHAPGIELHDREAVLALFAERLEEYGATVHRAGTADLASALAAALPAGRVVVPEGFPAAWLREWTGEAVPDHPPLPHAELDSLDAVLTTCAAGVADSGTLVLDAGPGQGRRAATLLPDLHVCVVRATQVVSSIPEVMARLDPRRPLTWISGPSATADIEMIRVPGVHGPRRLTVLLVADSS